MEFYLGTDPRAFSTSGGIISDGWVVYNGLDPFVVWDDMKTNNVTYADLFLHGLNLADALDYDYAAWWSRGLEPGVDEWIEEEDLEVRKGTRRRGGRAGGSDMDKEKKRKRRMKRGEEEEGD
jgi:hypothetical protein